MLVATIGPGQRASGSDGFCGSSVGVFTESGKGAATIRRRLVGARSLWSTSTLTIVWIAA